MDLVGRDVDMFGHEDGTTLCVKKKALEEETTRLHEIKGSFSSCTPSIPLDRLSPEVKCAAKQKLLDSIKSTSIRIRDGRELQFKQKFALQKFKTMGGEKWRDSKYVYVISSLQASLFQLREFSSNALSLIKDMGKLVSVVNPCISLYPKRDQIDVSFQENLISLIDTNESKDIVESRFVKQRSEIWTALRKTAYVTGSSIYDAIGMRGLKKQKEHFAKVFEGKVQNVEPDVAEKLKYGSDKEKHAMATLVGYFLPGYFPDCHFVEEGCYFKSGQHISTLIEVSPDGSLRKIKTSPDGIPISIGNTIAAIEIKCPFPSGNQMPVHYSIPVYYVCQCLSEMAVLETDTLIYVSYSKESTTFFKLEFDAELWDEVLAEITSIYDQQHPVQPRKLRPAVQILKSKFRDFVNNKVTFLAEFPSLDLEDSGQFRECEDVPFRFCHHKLAHDEQVTVEGALLICESALKVIDNGYNLLRKRATEVMVWVLTNKDRNSKLEIPCSLPIAYGLKDYKLTNQAFRCATEEILKECRKRGIRVFSFATDGQWIQTMVRDGTKRPLTIYELQKDVWSDVQKLTKAELVRKIALLNKITGNEDDILSAVHVQRVVKDIDHQNSSTVLYVFSKDIAFEKITTSSDERVWLSSKSQPKKNTDNQETSTPSLETMNTDWLPDSIISTLQEREDSDIQSVLETVDRDSAPDSTVTFTDRVSYEETPAESTSDKIDSFQVCQEEHFSQPTTPTRIPLINNDFILNSVFQLLRSDAKTGKHWNNLEIKDLETVLKSKASIADLTHNEINVICTGLISLLPTTIPEIRTSWKKGKKLEVLGALLEINELDHDLFHRKSKQKNVKRLQQLAIQAIQSKRYPKLVLSAAYASYLFPSVLKEWQNGSTIGPHVKVEGFEDDIPFWFSYPERNESTGEIMCKSLDCSHNLTHLRVLTCTNGFGNVTSDGWKACARANTTALKVPLVEDIIDKQSVPNARTHFSSEVETWLKENNFEEAGKLTRLVRNWYEASDSPGISSVDRVQHLIDMRTFLLGDTDFGKFPPKKRYINGIPVVTFQGMCIDIDTKIQMYGITGSYNIRSVGSLAAETTVGVLQSLSPVSQVSIKARDVPALMSTLVEVMTCKINTDRYAHVNSPELKNQVITQRC